MSEHRDLSRYEFENIGDLWAIHIEKLRALRGVLAAARYVLDAEDAGYPGHAPLARLRQAVEAFDA